jgi:hypothetical protein
MCLNSDVIIGFLDESSKNIHASTINFTVYFSRFLKFGMFVPVLLAGWTVQRLISRSERNFMIKMLNIREGVKMI